MEKKQLLTVKDILEYVAELSVQRFGKTSLHKESLIKQIKEDRNVKSFLNINLFKAQNSMDIINSINKTHRTKKRKHGLSKRSITRAQLAKMDPKTQETLILAHYTGKDSRTLSELEFKILNVVSKAHEINPDVILSRYRGLEVVYARNQFMVLMNRNFQYPLARTGSIVSRDHSTVINGKEVHDTIMELNSDKLYVKRFNQIVNELKKDYPEHF